MSGVNEMDGDFPGDGGEVSESEVEVRISAKRTDEETVDHPEHYGGDTVYEVIKVIEAWDLGFHLGNNVKYIARAGRKDPEKELEDLRKAQWYLERKISLLEGRTKKAVLVPAKEAEDE